MIEQLTASAGVYLHGVGEGLRDAAIIFAVFLVGGLLYCLLKARSRTAADGDRRGIFADLFRSDLYRHPSARSDRWNFFLSYLIWLPLMRLILSAVVAVASLQILYDGMNGLLPSRAPLIDTPAAVTAFQFGCLFIGAELGSYLAHLAMHRVPLLWSIHRVHHSAESLTVFTRLRDHPLDFLISGLGRVALGAAFAAVPIVVVGAPPRREAIMLYFAVAFALPFITDAWRHCHLPMTLGWFNRIFNAPIMHQVHHSAEPRHFDKNLGAELMIFDWIFGTLYLPTRDEKYRWGLNERELGENNPHNRLYDFYVEPFRYAGKLIRSRRSSGRAAAAADPGARSEAANVAPHFPI